MDITCFPEGFIKKKFTLIDVLGPFLDNPNPENFD